MGKTYKDSYENRNGYRGTSKNVKNRDKAWRKSRSAKRVVQIPENEPPREKK